MIVATTPIGTPIRLAEGCAEDRRYFRIDECADAVRYYNNEGYVVLRGLLARDQCDRILAAFDREVRPSRRPILRQTNMRYEPNIFDADGFLANPIFNVHDLETRTFPSFKTAALDVLTDDHVAQVLAALLGDEAKLVQSMFFEGSVGTWAHQDSYYQDGTEVGRCVAGWFSLEDMSAKTGRFYVCPASHRLPVIRNEGELNIAYGHDRYKERVLATLKDHGLEWRSPYLAKGDVLFWNSRTIHGSLPARKRGVSRRSLTAHYLPVWDEMLQFHSRVRRQDLTHHNGMSVGRLHNQDQWRNRLIRHIAARYPEAFGAARKLGIRALLALGALLPMSNPQAGPVSPPCEPTNVSAGGEPDMTEHAPQGSGDRRDQQRP